MSTNCVSVRMLLPRLTGEPTNDHMQPEIVENSKKYNQQSSAGTALVSGAAPGFRAGQHAYLT